jgi:hypothetical protein
MLQAGKSPVPFPLRSLKFGVDSASKRNGYQKMFLANRARQALKVNNLTIGKDCAGEVQQQLYTTDPTSRRRGRPTSTNPQLSKDNLKNKENWSRFPDAFLTTRQTGRLTVWPLVTFYFHFCWRFLLRQLQEQSGIFSTLSRPGLPSFLSHWYWWLSPQG